MPIFQLDKSLKELSEKPFEQERDMQRLVEADIGLLFGLKFVATEFSPQGDLRIDTLAYDPEQKSFVIMEFKKGNSWSVIDQGATYLSLMLDRKEAFVLRINESLGTKHTLKDIAWDASRVVFIAPSFNGYQEGSLGFRDLPIELWEIRRYAGDLITLNRVQNTKRNAKLGELKSDAGQLTKIRREVKQYTVDDHFGKSKQESRKLYDTLMAELMKLHSDFEVNAMKGYISLKLGWRNVYYIHIQKRGLIINFARSQPEDFNDPEKRLKYVRGSMEHYNQHISNFTINSEDDIPYAVMLAKQVLKKYEQFSV